MTSSDNVSELKCSNRGCQSTDQQVLLDNRLQGLALNISLRGVNSSGTIRLPSSESARIQRLTKPCPSPSLGRSNFQRLIEASGIKALQRIPETQLHVLFRVLGGSAYLSEILIRQGKDWPALFLRSSKNTQKTVADHLQELQPLVKNSASLSEFCIGLRRHKQREYLRIGTRDLDPSATLEETVAELTALAEASLDTAYQYCRADVEKDFGKLILPGNQSLNRFVVLGMGKLGGGELNFSSEVDVVFLYEEDDGESSGGSKGKA